MSEMSERDMEIWMKQNPVTCKCALDLMRQADPPSPAAIWCMVKLLALNDGNSGPAIAEAEALIKSIVKDN